MHPKKPHICWRCGHPLKQTGYGKASICPGCRTSTRVCRNCLFFSNDVPRQCKEPSAGLIANKQQVNACAYFQAV